MKKYIPKTKIDEYIDNNVLNSRIYQVLLNFQNSKAHCQNELKRTPLEIFNEAYAICKELEQERHPEQSISEIWDRLRESYLLCETNIIFSCVYVILLFSQKENPNMQFFLTCCKHKIDKGYFREFEPLIREELTQITAITDDFDVLKKEADKISDLNQRELFYAGYLAHYKQVQHKGNIVLQISDEIELIQRIKELSTIENDSVETASIKVRAIVILELLDKMQLSRANKDLTKICKLIAFLTGNSYRKIYSELQKGICLSKYHSPQIDEANKIFEELEVSISIYKDRQY
jgi:hypothetical protein